MTLAERLSEYVRACFTGLWIESHEHQDALAEIAGLCRREDWRLATWNIASGLSIDGQTGESTSGAGQDPLAAIRSLAGLASANGTALLVLENFHRFLGSPEIVQSLVRQVTAGKQNRTFVVILAPVIQIPVELEKLFVVVSHDLPGREPLAEIARGIATEPGELPEGAERETLLDAACGLTRHEAEAAFSLSLVRHGKLQAEAVWELKSQTLRKSGLLTLHPRRRPHRSLPSASPDRRGGVLLRRFDHVPRHDLARRRKLLSVLVGRPHAGRGPPGSDGGRRGRAPALFDDALRTV